MSKTSGIGLLTAVIVPHLPEKGYKSATEILSSLLREKSSNQLKPQAQAIAANKHRTALNAIGCKLAIHPRKEEAMHPAMK
jgi:hypothetical protein